MEARSPASAMHQGALLKATITGTLLQSAMVIIGHFTPAIAASYPIVGTAIGAVTGFLFSRWGGRPTRMASASGGALAGGVAGMLGTIISAALASDCSRRSLKAAGSSAPSLRQRPASGREAFSTG